VTVCLGPAIGYAHAIPVGIVRDRPPLLATLTLSRLGSSRLGSSPRADLSWVVELGPGIRSGEFIERVLRRPGFSIPRKALLGSPGRTTLSGCSPRTIVFGIDQFARCEFLGGRCDLEPSPIGALQLTACQSALRASLSGRS
jgi:hypothetical protein